MNRRLIGAVAGLACCPALAGSGVANDPVRLPEDLGRNCEVWLCAGQSNMQKGWSELSTTESARRIRDAELSRLVNLNVWLWDFNDGSWTRQTPETAGRICAYGVSFAIRRAETTGRSIALLYVAAGGAPTESFLSRDIMQARTVDGKWAYPHLARIAANTNTLDRNSDFPCDWCAAEYPRRRHNRDEGRWWPVSAMYEAGIARIGRLKLAGVLWYQGESNATAGGKSMPTTYVEETLRAVVRQLRPNGTTPFLMMGLPRMNRPWQPYREAQRRICAETGAVYLDSYGAGLGDPADVHPADKRPFAELAASAAAR